MDFVSFSYYSSRCITVGLRVTLNPIYYRYKKVIASDGEDLSKRPGTVSGTAALGHKHVRKNQ